jgi:hypothetical protein
MAGPLGRPGDFWMGTLVDGGGLEEAGITGGVTGRGDVAGDWLTWAATGCGPGTAGGVGETATTGGASVMLGDGSPGGSPSEVGVVRAGGGGTAATRGSGPVHK